MRDACGGHSKGRRKRGTGSSAGRGRERIVKYGLIPGEVRLLFIRCVQCPLGLGAFPSTILRQLLFSLEK